MSETEQQRTLRLEAQLAAVTARVYLLEQELATLRAGPAAGATTRAMAEEPGSAALPLPEATPAAQLREERSLENRVGSQWFNRIGIVAVLIGVAWFLKFAFDNHWVGDLGRLLIGLISGVVLIAWSERFRIKGYAAFSYSLKALGTGVLYLSLWAAVSVYHLVGPGVGFAGMIAVTAWNAFIAWRQDAELLAVYAIVGAFATPLLLSTGQNEEVFLFSYLLLMNAAMLTLLVLKGWNRLLVLAFVGTVSLYCGWYWNYYAATELGTTVVFLLLFFLLFAAATVLGHERTRGTHDDVARLLVSMGNAAFGFRGLYAMLTWQGRSSDAELAWCAVGFGAVYFGVSWFLQRGAARGGRPSSLADVHLALAIVFFTLAIPLAVHGHWVTVGWMVEGATLVWVATRKQSMLLPALAVGALMLGLVSLAVDATDVQTQVIWNTRLLSFAVAIAVMALSAMFARRAAARESGASSAAWWRTAARTSAVVMHLLVVIAVALEIHTYWWTRPLVAIAESPGYFLALKERAMATQFTYSAWFLLAGALLLVAGFRSGSASLRWQGLALLAITILKVFLMDTSQLSQGYRIVSFLALGALLLGVSFAYQKDWLRLRASANHEAQDT